MVKGEQNLEQGFNEDELQDIMNEIESLESEFPADNKPAPKKAAAAPKTDGEEAFSMEEMDEVLNELNDMGGEPPHKNSQVEATNVHPIKREELKKVAPVAETKSQPRPISPSMESSSAPVSMSFSVNGSMALNMSFNVSGNEISLSVTEDGLSIEMPGGGKFVLPINEKSSSKKAA